MKHYIADTNFLLSYFTNRNPGQQRIAAKYIHEATEGICQIHIPEITLTELVYVLTTVYGRPPAEIKEIIIAMGETPGIYIEGIEISQLFSLWPNTVKDWGDALLALHVRSKNTLILTFDRPLRKQLEKVGISCEKI